MVRKKRRFRVVQKQRLEELVYETYREKQKSGYGIA